MNLTIIALLSASLAFAGAPPNPTTLHGTVMETLDAGDYTYVRVKSADGERWAAIPKAALKPGEAVRVEGSAVMEAFTSPRLKRRFDRVLFGVLAPSSPAAPIAKAEGPEGRTVAAVYAERKALEGKKVTVHGKVVKFNAQIMGSNWLHLRDGTGTADGKDNDLTVVTKDGAAVGDVVTARGTLGLNRDFGAGYVYPVLLEAATVVKP